MATESITVPCTHAPMVRAALEPYVALRVVEQWRLILWRTFTITGPAHLLAAALRAIEDEREAVNVDAGIW